MVVANVETGSAGAMNSKSCFNCLGLINDNEVEFEITLAKEKKRR